MSEPKNERKIRLDFTDMRIGIKDLIFVGGIVFGALTFYFTTTAAIKTHTQEIETLKTSTVKKEVYELSLAQRKEKEASLEKAIKELTQAVIDLRIELAERK